MIYVIKRFLKNRPKILLNGQTINGIKKFQDAFILYSNCKQTEWVLVAQSCLTLCNATDYSPPGSSVHGKITGMGCHFLLKRNMRVTHISCEVLLIAGPPRKPNWIKLTHFHDGRTYTPSCWFGCPGPIRFLL